MKVTTDLTRKDLLQFNLSIFYKLKANHKALGYIIFFSFMFNLWLYGVPNCLKDWLINIFVSVTVGLIAMLVGVIISFCIILASSKKSNGILGEHHYEIDEKGLHEKTTANEGTSLWGGIEEIKVVKSFLLFRISSYLFHIIPKRSFSSEQQFNQFYQTAQNFWRQAQAKK